MGRKTYKLFHHYDIGDRSVYIDSENDPSDAVAYLQFKAEELSNDSGIQLSNLAVANALIVFYDCGSGSRTSDSIDIDLYSVREERCGTWYKNKESLSHLVKPDNDLLEVLSPHFGDQ